MLAVAASVGTMFAYDVQLDGVCYNLDSNKKVASVTHRGSSSNYNFSTQYSGDIIIPPSITYSGIRYDVTSIEDKAFYYSIQMLSVSIPNSITNIGNDAFGICSNLKSIIFPDGVSKVGIRTFRNCKELTSVSLGANTTEIGESAFEGCSKLYSLVIGNSIVRIGDYAFNGCSSLTIIELPNSVTSIGRQAFASCRSLESIDVSTENQLFSSVDGVLFDKSKETLICYPAGKTDDSYAIPNSVSRIEGLAFAYNNLISISIPESVINIGAEAFYQCNNLPIIDNVQYADNYLVGVKDDGLSTYIIQEGTKWIGSAAFSNCYNLTTIDIPSSVKYIEEVSFYGCYNLSSVTNHAFIPQETNDVFNHETYIQECSLYVPANSINLYKEAEGWKEFKEILPIPGTEPCITASGTCGAQGDNLTWELSCDGVITIGGTGEMANWDEGSMPWYLNKTDIKSVVIEDGVTSVGSYAFANSSNITSIEIPNSVENIGSYAFFDCSSLSSLTIPDDVSSIGYYICSGCVGLTQPVFNATIFVYMPITFEGAYTIPEGITTIAAGAFYGCTSLSSIDLSNRVSYIGDDAFQNCTGLTTVIMGTYMVNICNDVFNNCSALNSITCAAKNPPYVISSNSFLNVTKTIPVYVPYNSFEDYKTAKVWKDFKNYQAIPNTEPQKFKITWQDEEGNPIKVDEVAYGETPVFSGATPVKDATAEYTYEFAGWLPKVKEVTEDTKYTTFFERNKIEPTVYNVNINGENCSLRISNELPAGTRLQVEAVADECFEFQKWSDNNTDNPRTITVTEDSNLTAEFNKVTYAITGENENEGGEVQIIP